jgi:DNA-binding NarL/FixJ family response regulator
VALRVLLVDDHTFFRAGLRSMLEDAGVEVAEAGSARAALEIVARAPPDVVLMDLHMPGMSGLDATRALAQSAAGVPVVMLTVSTDDADVVDAVRAGARGYLLKEAGLEEILAGARAAASGSAWVSPRVVGALVAEVRRADAAPDPGAADLSDRELEILRLIAEGRDNTQIGAALYISPATVRKHVSSILRKLEVTNRVEAAVYAIRRGLA